MAVCIENEAQVLELRISSKISLIPIPSHSDASLCEPRTSLFLIMPNTPSSISYNSDKLISTFIYTDKLCIHSYSENGRLSDHRLSCFCSYRYRHRERRLRLDWGRCWTSEMPYRWRWTPQWGYARMLVWVQRWQGARQEGRKSLVHRSRVSK